MADKFEETVKTPLHAGINASYPGGPNALLRGGGGAAETSDFRLGTVVPFSMTCGLTYDTGNAAKGKVTMVDAGNLYDQYHGLIVNPVVSSEWAVTASAPTNVTIGAASATVLALNESRTCARFTNTHATQTVYLSLDGSAAESQKGIYLAPAGGTWEMNNAAGNLTVGTVKGIASGANTVIAIQEWT